MARPLTNIDKIINVYLSKYKDNFKVFLFKMSNCGEVQIKHGYILKNSYRDSPYTFIDINASSPSNVRLKTATKEGEQHRNTVWYIEEGNDEEECFIKAVDTFTKNKKDQLEKLNQQVNLIKREIKRLEKLKEEKV